VAARLFSQHGLADSIMTAILEGCSLWKAKSGPKTAPCGSHRVLRFGSELTARLPVRIHEGDDLFEPRDYITGLQELLLFIDLR
jgi:hypothetical protein